MADPTPNFSVWVNSSGTPRLLSGRREVGLVLPPEASRRRMAVTLTINGALHFFGEEMARLMGVRQ